MWTITPEHIHYVKILSLLCFVVVLGIIITNKTPKGG
jgi:hypothetical protein